MNDGTKNRSVTITPSGIVEDRILSNTRLEKNSCFYFGVRNGQKLTEGNELPSLQPPAFTYPSRDPECDAWRQR